MKNILEIRNLEKEFDLGFRLKNINFDLKEGEFLGLLGESGSGKSTISKLIVGLVKSTSGEIIYKDKNIFTMSKSELKNLREEIQMIFQNPYTSLNLKYRVREILLEGLKYKKNKEDLKEIDIYLEKILLEVGLNKEVLNKFPHQLSGGERQRIGIARALLLKPKILIADECLSSLDILTQTEILKIFLKIKKDFKLSCIFISHDLTIINKICDRIIVLKDGEIVEIGNRDEILKNPKNDYSKKLVEMRIKIKKDFI